MPRHYSYRVDHDLGFAPHIWRNVMTVCGCKTTTIERWAEAGSWVVGIGGKGTGQPDKLIYVMNVTETLTYQQFRMLHRANASYLSECSITNGEMVLLSRGRFAYFGDKAPTLPPELSHIVHRFQGCKRISDDDIIALIRFLKKLGYGKHGEPNNAPARPACKPPRRATAAPNGLKQNRGCA